MQIKELARIIKNRLGVHLLSCKAYETIYDDIMSKITPAEALHVLKKDYEIKIAKIKDKRYLKLIEKNPNKEKPLRLETTLNIKREFDYLEII